MVLLKYVDDLTLVRMDTCTLFQVPSSKPSVFSRKLNLYALVSFIINQNKTLPMLCHFQFRFSTYFSFFLSSFVFVHLH